VRLAWWCEFCNDYNDTTNDCNHTTNDPTNDRYDDGDNLHTYERTNRSRCAATTDRT
jgi:hypothetical protein